jgi:hypothetical protein
VTVILVLAVGAVAGAQTEPGATIGFGDVTPGSGAPGTEITYTVVGSPNADSECRGSSAFATELLASDGTRLATGADTIVVSDAATPGPGYLRLICYIADSTGRRVIRGICAPFEILPAGSAAGASGTGPISEPCPPSGRVLASQSVIGVSGALGQAFNQVITPLGG